MSDDAARQETDDAVRIKEITSKHWPVDHLVNGMRYGGTVPVAVRLCCSCRTTWPCGTSWLLGLVERLAESHARCTNLSNAEAARIFQEAKEQRERAERLTAENARLAVIVGKVTPVGDLDLVTSLQVKADHAGQHAEQMIQERDAALVALAAALEREAPSPSALEDD